MRKCLSTQWTAGRSGKTAPLIVGAICFALVLGTLWVVRPEKPSTEPSVQPAPLLADVSSSRTKADDQPEPAPQRAVVQEVIPAPRQTPSLREIILSHLSAGEYGPAVDLAASVTDAGKREELLRLIVDAQRAAGDFDAALATLKQMESPFEADEFFSSESLAGGTGADFTQLIDLIQNETGAEDYGPWLDIHGSGGTISQFDSGVRVDPYGVLAAVRQQDTTGALSTLARRARKADLNEEMARPSSLRMVSLTRLEKRIAERLAAGQPVVESMKQLAGLSQVQYIFLYPEEGEIVLAGPAEGWAYNEHGMPVGLETGRPTLQLDDLVTVLRTFSESGLNRFGCSIDPRPENLQELQEFVALSQARGPLRSGQAGRWAKQLGEKLGMQDVTIYGVPADSRVARVIVEADYRMKLIGIGKLDAGSEIPDYFALLAAAGNPSSGRLDALRWWLTMKYDAVAHSDRQDAYQIRGSAVRCQSENEFLTSQGERVPSGDAEPINRLFAANFTQHYESLAEREPIFADMHGVFDLAMVAALIQQDGLDRRVGWDRGVFQSGGAYLTASYAVPKEVETVVNHRVFHGKDVVVQVAGGVKADFLSLIQNKELRRTAHQLNGLADQNRPADLPAGRWWWDAR